MKIAVIGLGKIGLPIAVQYARMGNEVIGVDLNQSLVSQINQAFNPYSDEDFLEKFLKVEIEEKRLCAISCYDDSLTNVDVFVIIVPVKLNVNMEADFKFIDDASKALAPFISKGTLICYETTLPVGTTRNRLTPLLERFSGLKAREEFHVVFSPERVFTGQIFRDLRKYPKIVGGLSYKCGQRGKDFYESVLEFDIRNDLPKPNGVWVLRDAETAEFTKLAETTYRDVNIGLANQFSIFADSTRLNIYEVIEAANSQSVSHIHQPGISVGGHCIPVYPHFYLMGDKSADIVRTARQVNLSMPAYAVATLNSKLNGLNKRSILVLGVSYRANVKEESYSGAFSLQEELINHGANPYFVDPNFTAEELTDLRLRPFLGNYPLIDAAILHTPHLIFKEFMDEKFLNCKFVLDGRNFLSETDVSGQLITLGNLLD